MTTLEWIIYSSCGIAFLCILIGAINDLRHLKSKTMKYLTQLDEIDQWLADNFGIMPGACSSTENLRYNTARTIAEALWPKCKDSLHIQEMCKENGDSFTDEADSKKDSGDSIKSNDLEEAAETYAENRSYLAEKPSGEIVEVYNIAAEEGFKNGATWMISQGFSFEDKIYPTTDNAGNVTGYCLDGEGEFKACEDAVNSGYLKVGDNVIVQIRKK